MNRGRQSRGARQPRPVTRIDLTEERSLLKPVLFLVLLVGGLICLGLGLNSLLTASAGTEIIETSTSDPDCGGDFVLAYAPGGEAADRTVLRQLTRLYSDEAVHCYRVFHACEGFADTVNLYAVNHAPNREIAVDPVLYGAFRRMLSLGGRRLYLGPAEEYCENLFAAQDSAAAEVFDPGRDEDTAAYYAELLRFVRDPRHITLELLGDDRVCLHISPEYEAFIRENGIECPLGFGWLKNAFIADRFASVLEEHGYTHYTLMSLDGFTRAGTASEAAVLPVYRSENGRAVQKGTEGLPPGAAAVRFAALPCESMPNALLRTYDDGSVFTGYLSEEDGRCAGSVPFLSAVSESCGCAETALRTAPLFIAPGYDEALARALEAEGFRLTADRGPEGGPHDTQS